MPSLKRPKSTLAQMALSSNQYALKVQRLDKILAHKAAPKVPDLASYGNFRGEIFQRTPKKQPSLKKANSTLAEMALSSN